MKIDKIILSTNNDPNYIEFLPYVVRAWKKLLGDHIEIIIGYASEKPCNDEMRKYATIYQFWTPNIPLGNIAKISRLLLTLKFTNNYCLLSDMDMLPLQASYFSENSDLLEDSKILFYSADAYTWQNNRFPICYILAKGMVFKEIVNPDNLSERGLIRLWSTPHLEAKSSLFSDIFSDESLLRWLLIKWNKPHRIQRLNRGWINGIARNRIDRYPQLTYDLQKLKEGYYIDCHMPRPLHKFADKMEPVFNYILGNNQ